MAGLTKPSEIFTERVLPAYLDCLADPGSERRANIAAQAVSDHLEWVFQYYQAEDPPRLNGAKNVGEFRRQMIARCSALHILWDAGDAVKHRFLTRRRDPAPLIQSSTAAYHTAPAGELLLGEAPFLPMLQQAVDFWQAWPD